MRRSLTILAAATMIAAVGTSAFGQTYVTTGQGPSMNLNTPPMMNPSAPSLQDLDRMAFSDQQNRLAREKPERIALASQVETLIEQGRCGPAAQLAWAKGDEEIARRVPQACAAWRAKHH